jgi:hypothetical protein
MLYSEMTDKIINSFYKVYDVLSYGFLENFKRAIFSNERKEISEIETSNPCESAQSASSAFVYITSLREQIKVLAPT